MSECICRKTVHCENVLSLTSTASKRVIKTPEVGIFYLAAVAGSYTVFMFTLPL